MISMPLLIFADFPGPGWSDVFTANNDIPACGIQKGDKVLISISQDAIDFANPATGTIYLHGVYAGRSGGFTDGGAWNFSHYNFNIKGIDSYVEVSSGRGAVRLNRYYTFSK